MCNYRTIHIQSGPSDIALPLEGPQFAAFPGCAVLALVPQHKHMPVYQTIDSLHAQTIEKGPSSLLPSAVQSIEKGLPALCQHAMDTYQPSLSRDPGLVMLAT